MSCAPCSTHQSLCSFALLATLHMYQEPQAMIPPRYLTVPLYTHPTNAFDEMIKKRYTAGDERLRDALSRAPLDFEARQQFQGLLTHLRIHKNLFMHTYVHLVSCCNGGYLHKLVNYANIWKEWDSVKQLARHSMIKSVLVDFWDYTCPQHRSLFAQHFFIADDDNDLLCHLLYCCRKPELYELSDKSIVRWNHGPDFKESEQVIDLLWEFLVNAKEKDVERHLRAHIYRMARKSAYLPRALQIARTSISYERTYGPSGNGLAATAIMNGGNVFIKRVMCNGSANLTKCLEMFASEAILWKTLQHKNIVPFFGVVAEGTSFMGLVSPFYRNGSINHYMRDHPRDWVTLTKRFAKDIVKGLEYIHCHEPPIVHGNLKGDNVLVDDEGHARLGDFSQSYASDTGKYLDSTRIGLQAVNSPFHWMAPELLLGGGTAKTTVKSDMYSFGCVLYEMLSGHIPFEGFSPREVMQCIREHKRPGRPESVKERDRVWRVAGACWESNPEDRPSVTRVMNLLR
ncbi:kinase-like domain-containing protein [Chiua virens]|nr:kinase-like domain-containing protein [Chiua virens]